MNGTVEPDRFSAWMAGLEARQLSDLTFSEVSRALRALSSTYVERRSKLVQGAALSGVGKRAAFALFYGPLHFRLVQHVAGQLGNRFTSIRRLLDLGCGTGASGAGWAMACARPPRVTGIDRHPWAINEARLTFDDLRLTGSFRVGDLTDSFRRGARQSSGGAPRDRRAAPWDRGARLQRRRDAAPQSAAHIEHDTQRASDDAILLAYAVNELEDAGARENLLAWLLQQARNDVRIVIVEPLAGFVAPWWPEWRSAFEAEGGRHHEWRVHLPLPPIVEKLDRAAGLNHRELKARSLSL